MPQPDTLAPTGLGARIEIVRGKVEELAKGLRVDVLVSEPMGTLLVNERMLETYLFARDHFLQPGGRMFPVRTVPSCPFCIQGTLIQDLLRRVCLPCDLASGGLIV